MMESTNSFAATAVLSSTDIVKERLNGNIIIEPFNEINLSNCSYDVRLGEFYYSNRGSEYEGWLNPWKEDSIKRYWDEKYKAAYIVADPYESNKTGLPVGSKYILLPPRGSILGHTEEFIGGKNFITSIIHSRSTTGRSEISICNDAGYGDVGFTNRWTLEIRNLSDVRIVLPVGIRLAQIIFFYSSKPIKCYNGKYQKDNNIEDIIKNWKPSDMLPKGYLDSDVPKPKPIDKSWIRINPYEVKELPKIEIIDN